VSSELRHSWAVCFLVIVALSTMEAQDVFDVVSIKPRSGERVIGGASTPDRFVRADATLRDLIRYAYNVQDFQIEGGPAWVASSRFEVNARAATAPAGPDGMRALVRRLLADRFRLRTRPESRDMPRYDLIVARRDGRLGEKLRPSRFDCEAILASGAATADDLARCDVRFRPKMGKGSDGRPMVSTMTLMLQGLRLPRLATLLQNSVERVVIDKTGLDGTFDLELEFSPDGSRRPVGLPGPPSSSPSDGPPLTTALQEQLGLKLEAVRGPVPVVVIENAELPMPD
jgi:bla regulator protein BlaR1